MKAPVDKATTARVLADIADAVRPVDMARTAAAVERVLATASRGCSEAGSAFVDVTLPVLRDLGHDVGPADWTGDMCPFCMMSDRETDNGLDGWFFYYLNQDNVPRDERERYAPHVVSPHLFEAVDQ